MKKDQKLEINALINLNKYGLFYESSSSRQLISVIFRVISCCRNISCKSTRWYVISLDIFIQDLPKNIKRFRIFQMIFKPKKIGKRDDIIIK